MALCLLSHIFISHFTCVENIPTCNRLAVKCMGTGNMSYPFQSCWLFLLRYANASCNSHNITFRFTFGFENCFPKSFTNVSKLLHLFSWFVRVALNEAHEWNKCQMLSHFQINFQCTIYELRANFCTKLHLFRSLIVSILFFLSISSISNASIDRMFSKGKYPVAVAIHFWCICEHFVLLWD